MTFTVNNPKSHNLSIQMALKVLLTDLPEGSRDVCVHGFLL